MKDNMRLTVGEKLYFVPSDRRDDAVEFEVTKVGRKWANLRRYGRDDYYRVHLDELFIDGGKYSPPGQCYLSKEHYEREMTRLWLWQEFTRRLERSRPPVHLSPEDIRIEALKLGIRLPNEPEESE